MGKRTRRSSTKDESIKFDKTHAPEKSTISLSKEAQDRAYADQVAKDKADAALAEVGKETAKKFDKAVLEKPTKKGLVFVSTAATVDAFGHTFTKDNCNDEKPFVTSDKVVFEALAKSGHFKIVEL